MTAEDQPTAPAGLHPETAVICAGRPGHTASEPLNVPVVLASNFHSDAMAAPGTWEDSRAYSRTDATPTWEALETAVGQVEGGHAVAFSSGMAAIAAVLDLLPAGTRIVAPEDCYFGVGELLADGQQQGRWIVDRVNLTDTASVQAAVAGADLLWLETPSNPLLEVADLLRDRRALPFDPELPAGPGAGHRGPALHHAICSEAARHISEVGTCHPDRALPHGPDPALRAARLGDRERWLEPVTQVVPHQAAGRSCPVTITHDKPVNIHTARKSRQIPRQPRCTECPFAHDTNNELMQQVDHA